MTPLRRLPGSRLAATLALSVLAASCGGGDGGGPNGNGGGNGASPSPPPSECPLTGQAPESGTVPIRPALAVKVENLPSVRPQTGLSFADIVYEEPVEGGITRFIVVYQCQDADKILPIRSARYTDPPIVRQFGRALFAYAGGVPQVVQRVAQANLIDVNFNRHPDAYHRDPAHSAPHDVYSSTEELYAEAPQARDFPEPIFTYSTSTPRGRKVSEAHVPFSFSSDVVWRWNQSRREWLRFHGDEPHTYSDGTQVGAENVVVQLVEITVSDVSDVLGNPSPEVVATGSGKAYVFRNGRVVVGRWIRNSVNEVTKFVDSRGQEIALRPGNTWVELLPNQFDVETA